MIEWNINIILIVAAILIAAFVIKRRVDTTDDESEDNNDDRDINREFLEAAKSASPIPFVRIYNNQDKMVLRSILDSEGIPTYLDLDHVSSLFPGVKIQGHTDSILYILDRDIEIATEIVKDYIESAADVLRGNPVSKTQAVADIVSAVNLKPTSRNRILPDILSEESAAENSVEE